MQVHHITPARSDLNFGKAINDLIVNLPDEDWICLRDIDTIPPLHKEFILQCEQIASEGKFDLVSCMTNRIGLNHQLHKGIFNEDFNFMNHKTIAQELHGRYGCQVVETKKTIAGLMMMFKVETWRKVGGFPLGGIQIKNAMLDYWFCKKIIAIGGKMGIAKGIYLFHAYRMGEVNPRRSTKHLTTKLK